MSSTGRRRRGKPLKRTPGKRPERRTIVVFCEGANSEPDCAGASSIEWPQNHPNLLEAKALAESNEVSLAISNPCFELWLILHFQNHHAFIDTTPAERLSRSLENRPGKSIDAALYMPLRKVACRRAEQLDKRHERDGTNFPHDNPSSGVYKFLKAVEGE